MRMRSYLMALVAPYVVIGAVAFTAPHLAGAAGNNLPVPAAPALPKPAPAKTPSHDGFADVVQRVRPAIVSIMAEKRAEAEPGVFRFGGGGFGGMGQGFGDEAPLMKGIGSGIVMTSDGTILTNNHVVEGATSLRVRLADGREFVGKVVGADPHSDVAVVKIDAQGLTAATFADSDKIAVGQYALAIGSPFGLESSVTLGIVSATRRGELGITDYEDFIQTDAAINPGNSGGALVDGDGNVIGMSTAIVANGGRGSLGIGLAVPANLARAVAAQLVAHGKVERGYLGAGIQDVTADLATAMGRSAGGGALVGQVKAGEAAARAGVQPGDVVVEIDGAPIASARELRLRVASTAPKTKIKMVVERNGKRVPLDVTLGTLPDDHAPGRGMRGGDRDDANQPAIGYGLQVGPLTADIAQELRLPPRTKGVVIMQVAPGSRADEAGLDRGDVIVEIDRKPASDPDALVKTLRSKSSGQHLLQVRRGDDLRYVALPALPQK